MLIRTERSITGGVWENLLPIDEDGSILSRQRNPTHLEMGTVAHLYCSINNRGGKNQT